MQDRIEEQVRHSALDVGGVEAEVDSFPLLTSILLDGRVDRVALTMRDVERNGIHFDRLRLVLFGMKVNRFQLLRGEAGASSIRRATLSARVTGPVAEAAAEAGEVPDGILPCDSVEMDVSGSVLRLSCSLRPVPQDLLEEFGILG